MLNLICLPIAINEIIQEYITGMLLMDILETEEHETELNMVSRDHMIAQIQDVRHFTGRTNVPKFCYENQLFETIELNCELFANLLGHSVLYEETNLWVYLDVTWKSGNVRLDLKVAGECFSIYMNRLKKQIIEHELSEDVMPTYKDFAKLGFRGGVENLHEEVFEVIESMVAIVLD
jgi:hypothetical protein